MRRLPMFAAVLTALLAGSLPVSAKDFAPLPGGTQQAAPEVLKSPVTPPTAPSATTPPPADQPGGADVSVMPAETIGFIVGAASVCGAPVPPASIIADRALASVSANLGMTVTREQFKAGVFHGKSGVRTGFVSCDRVMVLYERLRRANPG